MAPCRTTFRIEVAQGLISRRQSQYLCKLVAEQIRPLSADPRIAFPVAVRRVGRHGLHRCMREERPFVRGGEDLVRPLERGIDIALRCELGPAALESAAERL